MVRVLVSIHIQSVTYSIRYISCYTLHGQGLVSIHIQSVTYSIRYISCFSLQGQGFSFNTYSIRYISCFTLHVRALASILTQSLHIPVFSLHYFLLSYTWFSLYVIYIFFNMHNTLFMVVQLTCQNHRILVGKAGGGTLGQEVTLDGRRWHFFLLLGVIVSDEVLCFSVLFYTAIAPPIMTQNTRFLETRSCPGQSWCLGPLVGWLVVMPITRNAWFLEFTCGSPISPAPAPSTCFLWFLLACLWPRPPWCTTSSLEFF